jgi:hypothetical protein
LEDQLLVIAVGVDLIFIIILLAVNVLVIVLCTITLLLLDFGRKSQLFTDNIFLNLFTLVFVLVVAGDRVVFVIELSVEVDLEVVGLDALLLLPVIGVELRELLVMFVGLLGVADVIVVEFVLSRYFPIM